ncbi:MAG TPA: hypothetical protein VGR96_09255 [Acidobacteriaceae bacterium]|nr:hypothetical protein [Acidobacteriaceae bacterium]
MATHVAGSASERRGTPDHRSRLTRHHPLLILSLLTPCVLLIHGYHPYADDGAIYVAGIQKLLHPELYRHDAVFVLSQTRFSIFAWVLAAVVRFAHLPLPILLLACHLASIFLFLLGCWRVAVKTFATNASRWGAVLLAACFFTLPVAGTSIFIMDPYVTARSFSTPLSLFALAAALGGRWIQAVLWVALAAALHPLMAGFAAIFLLALRLAEPRMWRGLAVFGVLGLLLCALIFLGTRHVPLELASSQAALSRSYFFLSSWNWYEYPGLILPLVLLIAAAWRTRGEGPVGRLSAAAAVVGVCALLAAVCFVHRSGSLLLARLQVLRAFHMIYLAGALLLGGFAGRFAPKRPCLAAGAYCLVLLAMFAGQRLTYPASNPIEWPGITPRNLWQQAFLWIRADTPRDAIFGMDSDYIESAGEDAQGFRVMAERSAVADWYKDGGVASVFPPAQEQWWREVQTTKNLDASTDAQRIHRLKDSGASWILFPAKTATEFSCPYTNPAVKVCRLGVR